MEVYTGRISVNNIKLLSEKGYLPIFICRYMNPMVSMYKNTKVHCLSLSPSSSLLFDSKEGRITFDEYKKRYLEEISHENVSNILSTYIDLAECLDAKGVVLMCYCRDRDRCHRGILSEYLFDSGILNYKPKELVL